MSISNTVGFSRVVVKIVRIWSFFYVDDYISPILHNHINLESNVLYHLLDNGNVKLKIFRLTKKLWKMRYM